MKLVRDIIALGFALLTYKLVGFEITVIFILCSIFLLLADIKMIISDKT